MDEMFEFSLCILQSGLPNVFETSNLFHTQFLSTRLKNPTRHFVCSYVFICAMYTVYLTKLNGNILKSILLVGGKNTVKC